MTKVIIIVITIIFSLIFAFEIYEVFVKGKVENFGILILCIFIIGVIMAVGGILW